MTTLSAARLKSPAHKGYGRMVRAELERSGELSVYKLHLATGLDPAQIHSALTSMMAAGGVVSRRVKRSRGMIALYSLYKPPAPQRTRGQVAGPITIPQYNWAGTRLG